MRVVVTGATGNIGTSTVAACSADHAVTSIVGVARRTPRWQPDKTTWVRADVSTDDFTELLRDADALVHLAWVIQPARDPAHARRINVEGSRRLFEAAVAARVPAIVHASSLAAYSPGPKTPVGEDHPTHGIPTSPYSRHKVEVERILDRIEQEHRELRIVRMRPSLVVKEAAAAELRRVFLGPLFPNPLLRRGLLPALPAPSGVRFQVVHSDDVGDAFRRAATMPVEGAFNLAADPAVDVATLAKMLGTRAVHVPPALARAGLSALWRLRLEPTDPGWLDIGMQAPLLDISRAVRDLAWSPSRTGLDAVAELLAGLRRGAGFPTPPLEAGGAGPFRLGELAELAGVRAKQAAR